MAMAWEAYTKMINREKKYANSVVSSLDCNSKIGAQVRSNMLFDLLKAFD